MCAARAPLRRRASTPLPCAHQIRSQNSNPIMEICAPPPSQPMPDACSSQSAGSESTNGTGDGIFRVVLLGDPGVGKTSLVGIFRREQDREIPDQQQGKDKNRSSFSSTGAVLLWVKVNIASDSFFMSCTSMLCNVSVTLPSILPLTEITILSQTVPSSAFLSRKAAPYLFRHHQCHHLLPGLGCQKLHNLVNLLLFSDKRWRL